MGTTPITRLDTAAAATVTMATRRGPTRSMAGPAKALPAETQRLRTRVTAATRNAPPARS